MSVIRSDRRLCDPRSEAATPIDPKAQLPIKLSFEERGIIGPPRNIRKELGGDSPEPNLGEGFSWTVGELNFAGVKCIERCFEVKIHKKMGIFHFRFFPFFIPLLEDLIPFIITPDKVLPYSRLPRYFFWAPANFFFPDFREFPSGDGPPPSVYPPISDLVPGILRRINSPCDAWGGHFRAENFLPVSWCYEKNTVKISWRKSLRVKMKCD